MSKKKSHDFTKTKGFKYFRIIAVILFAVGIIFFVMYKFKPKDNGESPMQYDSSEISVSQSQISSEASDTESKHIEIVSAESTSVYEYTLPFSLHEKYRIKGIDFKYVIIAEAASVEKAQSADELIMFHTGNGMIFETGFSFDEAKDFLMQKGITVLTESQDENFTGIDHSADTGLIVFGG